MWSILVDKMCRKGLRFQSLDVLFFFANKKSFREKTNSAGWSFLPEISPVGCAIFRGIAR